MIGQFIVASTSYYFAFRKQWKLREQIKNQFGKYLDERMVKKLQDNPDLCQVNVKRVDCLLKFGSTNENIGIDSKLSWENYEKYKQETDENTMWKLLEYTLTTLF